MSKDLPDGGDAAVLSYPVGPIRPHWFTPSGGTFMLSTLIAWRGRRCGSPIRPRRDVSYRNLDAHACLARKAADSEEFRFGFP